MVVEEGGGNGAIWSNIVYAYMKFLSNKKEEMQVREILEFKVMRCLFGTQQQSNSISTFLYIHISYTLHLISTLQFVCI